MQQIVFECNDPPFRWIDVVDPSPEELEALAREHGLHQTSVQDCLEPEHLPKYERLDDKAFVIARAYDERAPQDAETAQELTRKVALFFSENILISVHRTEQRFLEELKRGLAQRLQPGKGCAERIVIAVLDGMLDTYWPPLDAAERAVSQYEKGLLERRDVATVIRDVYLLKRKVTSLRWMARHTLDMIQKLRASAEVNTPRLTDLKENADGLYFAADALLEDVNNLLHLQLSLAAHQTNEVMRILTVLSVFFMPLTFIVGVYGMNFQHMPELPQRWGYPAVWGVMLLTSLGIYLWFKRRGWL